MNKLIYNDTPFSWQFGFQNPATPVMEGIINLHNYVLMYLILVFVVVIWFLGRSLYLFYEEHNPDPMEFNHDPIIETVWTIAPAFILIAIAIPSFSLLYSMDDVTEPMLTVKAIGHQWYWSYELDAHRKDSLFDYFHYKIPSAKVYRTLPAYASLDKHLKVYLKVKGYVPEPKHKWYLRSIFISTMVNGKLGKFLEIKGQPRIFDMPSQILKTKIMANTKLYVLLKIKKTFKSFRHINKFVDIRNIYNYKLTQRMPIDYLWFYEFITYHAKMKDCISWVNPSIKFDSYMLQESDLPKGGLRLLEVDNRLVLPIASHVRFLITSMDVIHSWAVPSLGVKVDAIPGRLNQVDVFIKREGVFYGQCSELCGINHGFMPIVVVGADQKAFGDWVREHSNPRTLNELFASADWEIKAE